MAAVAAWGAVARGDDVVVEEQPEAEVPGFAALAAQVDLGGLFDAQVFGDGLFDAQVFGDEMGMVTEENLKPVDGQAPAADAVIARRLRPVRGRIEAKIDTIDRIVGLADKQRKKLEIAAESDLRRLTDAVAEARAKYAGRTLALDPRTGQLTAADHKEMEQAQADAQRCRQLVEAAVGPGSLLAKVVVGTLDEPQAKRYAAVMQGRAVCRWKAVVAAGLAQVDEVGGFTQRQHDTLTALLLADVPAAEDGLEQQGVAPAGVRVAQRLAAAGDGKLAAILDPRQRLVIAQFAQAADMMQGEGMGFGMGIGGGIGGNVGGGVF